MEYAKHLRKFTSSRVSGFFRISTDERQKQVQLFSSLNEQDLNILNNEKSTDLELLSNFVENNIGSFEMPMAIAPNFKINGKDYMLPLVVEESSVIAAISNAARVVYESGGFFTSISENSMIGQIEFANLTPVQTETLAEYLVIHSKRLIDLGNKIKPNLKSRGGGVNKILFRKIYQKRNFFRVVIHLIVDTQDAMGANIINTLCEELSKVITAETGLQYGFRILSNLADRRCVKAFCKIPTQRLAILDSEGHLSGQDVAKKIEAGSRFAESDPYRACTHNKGIMNGIDPLVLATGNDWRAVEAGAHAFAARQGQYTSLSRWRVRGENLIGLLRLPMQIGTVGGVTTLHPKAKIAMKILGYPNSTELSQIAAAAGLAANFSALKALATSGIQKGHMALHQSNLKLMKEKNT